jgi:hypothetical protein
MRRFLRRSLFNNRLAIVLAVLSGAIAPSRAAAETVTVNHVSFDLPDGLERVNDPLPPVVASWNGASEPVTVLVVAVPVSNIAESAEELQRWPGSGRSLIAGFGDAYSRTLGQALGVPCSFTGVPVSIDRGRMASKVSVDTTCAIKPQAASVRSLIVAVLTRSGQLIVRIDAQPTAYSSAESIAAAVWETLRVDPAQQVPAISRSEEAATVSASYSPVSGGAGVHLRSYGQIRPAYLAGEVIGALVAAILFGAALAVAFVRVGLRPFPALVASQVALALVTTWGRAHDGVWEVDWFVKGVSALGAIIVLRGWVRRRWDRRQLAITAAAAGAVPPSASGTP